MRVVVIGATGNVGTSVVRALEAEPAVTEILGLARRRPAAVAGKTRWAAADITSDDLVPHLRGADAVIALAWLIQPSRDPDLLHRVNVVGQARILEAVATAAVPTLAYASSVGAYSPGPDGEPVDESWPTHGVETSFYSRHKAYVERLFDAFESAHPEIAVVRMRPGLIFQRSAATGIRRLFIGPLLPNRLASPALLPFVPQVPGLRLQVVHSDDVAEAFRLALVSGARGAFNLAADPVLDVPALTRILNAKAVPLSPGPLRLAAAATWYLRLQPTSPGWVDMALQIPVMSTARARTELGWVPTRSAPDVLLEFLQGLHDSADFPTPPLDSASSGPLRSGELRTGVGQRTV